MKRIHEYSRSSRYRIRRLLQAAGQNILHNDPSSSSDSDDHENPLVPLHHIRNLSARDVEEELSAGSPATSSHDNNANGGDGTDQDMGNDFQQRVDEYSNSDHEEIAGDSSVESEAASNESNNEVIDEVLVQNHGSPATSVTADNSASGVDDNDQEVCNNISQSGSEQSNADQADPDTDNSVASEAGSNNDNDLGPQLDDDNELYNEFLRGAPDDWDDDGDVQIYDLAPITLDESMLAIFAFYLRHNLSLACLSDLLSLINLHCREEGNHFTKSLYHFKKFFSNLEFPIIRHYYCSDCFQRVPDADAVCTNNHTNGNEFFIQMSVISQLKALYKRPGFKEKLNHRFNRTKHVDANYEDIYDGAVYLELCEDGKILSNPNNISLMHYTDGVSIFKSSKSEITPFYFVINELPYHERTKVSNALLGGLWFGKSKPVPTTFLAPIRDDILTLRQGIFVSVPDNPDMVVEGICMCGTGDLPAKANSMNFKGHSAKYGCPKCKIETVNIRRGLNVYPFKENLQMRTEEETTLHAEEAMQLPLVNGKRQDVFGVKGMSMLSAFVYLWVRTMAVDEMHCVFLGILKSLLGLWFDQKHSDEPYSLFAHRNLINLRLFSMSPPGFIQRLTRDLQEVKYWKAHEIKTFFYYYSVPLFSDVMNEFFFEHHMLLVMGVYLLNQPSISEDQINLARELLTDYVSQFEDLYGIENMTCNLHQLLHFPDIVRDFGPLWVTSCFPFEDLNGKLKKLVKGTRYAALQICTGVSMLMKFAELTNRVPADRAAARFVQKIFDPNRGVKATSIGSRMAIVGTFRRTNVLPVIVQTALDHANIEGGRFCEFYRFKKYSTIYSSDLYERAVKTKSNCVKYRSGMDVGIGFMNRFLRVANCDCNYFCDDCDAKYVAVIRKCDTRQDFSLYDGSTLHFMHTLVAEGDYIAVQLRDILSICFVVRIAVTYFAEPVNMIEAE